VKQIRAILFDAGGTLILVDGERTCRAAGIAYEARAFERAEAAAVAEVRTWILRHPESTDRERLPLFLDTILRNLGLPEEEQGAAAERILREHRSANLWSRAAPGAVETLGELAGRGYRLAVVSNADGRVQALLEQAGLAPWLEFILDSAQVGVEKPDPRIFLAATERLALTPGACAYVGDIYEIDAAGARDAGLVPILVGSCPAPEFVERVPDLPALLDLFPGPPERPHPSAARP
jgi:putative hydrolase of the HAD superfamily